MHWEPETQEWSEPEKKANAQEMPEEKMAKQADWKPMMELCSENQMSEEQRTGTRKNEWTWCPKKSEKLRRGPKRSEGSPKAELAYNSEGQNGYGAATWFRIYCHDPVSRRAARSWLGLNGTVQGLVRVGDGPE
jgi:hypothetical protein